MSSAGSESRAVKSLDALTGLRFFAALAVIIVHMTNLAMGKNAGLDIFATNAVSFFFVLSGFILTYVYFTRLKWSGVLRFLVARIARIGPLAVVCLLAAVGIHLYRGSYRLDTGVSLCFLAHFFLIQSWLPLDKLAFWFNGPAWSISTEMGFYLAFPVLLLVGKKSFLPVFVLAAGLSVMAIVAAQYAVATGASDVSAMLYFSYVNPLFRLLEFAAGMLVGRIFLDRISATDLLPQQSGFRRTVIHTFFETMSLLVLVGLLYSVSTQGAIHNFLIDNHWTVVDAWCQKGAGSVLGFGLVIWVFSWSVGLLARLVSHPLVVYLGEISFALYLVQLPVIDTLEPFLPDQQLPVSFVVLMGIGICLALASLLHPIVELPSRQFLVSIVSRGKGRPLDGVRRIPDRLWHSGIGVGALVCLALCIGLMAIEISRCKIPN